MNSTTRFTSILTAAALAGLLLAGCTSAPLDLDIPVGIPTETDEPNTPDSTDEPIVDVEELAVGDTLSKDEALALNRDFGSGVRAYELPDGTYVVVAADAPLPPAVQAEVTGEVAGAANSAPSNDTRGISDSIGNAQYETGRYFIAVVPVQSACVDFGPTISSWGVADASRLMTACQSKDEAIAYAQSLIAGKADAAKWELIIS